MSQTARTNPLCRPLVAAHWLDSGRTWGIYLKVLRESAPAAGAAFRDVLDELLHWNCLHVVCREHGTVSLNHALRRYVNLTPTPTLHPTG